MEAAQDLNQIWVVQDLSLAKAAQDLVQLKVAQDRNQERVVLRLDQVKAAQDRNQERVVLQLDKVREVLVLHQLIVIQHHLQAKQVQNLTETEKVEKVDIRGVSRKFDHTPIM